MAVFSVTNLNDFPVSAAGDAPGTLRQAVFDANANPGLDEITFDDRLSGTILLNQGQLDVTESAAFIGPGAAQLTLEAFDPTPDDDNGDGNRIFQIDDETNVKQDVSISGLTLTGGDVDNTGGAIFSLEHLSIARSYITGNSVVGTAGFLTAGGGVYINNADLSVEDSTISDNYLYHDNAALGGGITSGAGNVAIRNSTISGNHARTPLGLSGGNGYGGGLAVGSGVHTFAHSTISDNRASGADSFGGGIFLFGNDHDTTIDHTILGDNNAEMGPEISSRAIFTMRYSLVENVGAGLSFIDGGGNILKQDPGLSDEVLDRGGLTPTYGLLPTSPVIDAGDPAARAGAGDVPEFDQRGAPFVRVADGDEDAAAVIDIGATERQTVDGLTLAVDTLIDENDADYSAGDLSLREAIGLANGSVGPDTITFADQISGQAIVLTKGQFRIVEDLTIDARTGAGSVIIDASGSDPTPEIKQGDGSRIFEIEADDNLPIVRNVALMGLHLTGGDVLRDGGAITSRENLQLVDATIDGNFAARYGGGIDQGNSNATLVITGSTISRNIAAGGTGNIVPIGFSSRGGGGIRLVSSDAEITSSTISGNRTVGNNSHGGGIAAIDNDLTVRHSTIAGNSTSGADSRGGNIFFRYGDILTLDHTIVADGSSPTDNDIHSPNDPVVANNSLIEDATGLTVNGAGNITGVDPRLGPLVENGGRTRTRALFDGSPAIDGGNIAFTAPPDFDQRDDPFVRIFNGNDDAFTIVDIGAYERQTVAGLNLVVDLALDEYDGNYAAGDLSLREAIGLANGSVGNDVITFAPELLGKTILLTRGELQIVDDVVIDATSLGGRLTIDASGNDLTPNSSSQTGDGSRVMAIDDGNGGNQIAVELIGLTLTGGDVLGNGGAVRNTEDLTITYGTVTGNHASALISTGNGAVGAGGGIDVRSGGLLLLSNSTIYDNTGDVGGGVAVNEGQVTINSSTISGNRVDADGGGLWAGGAGAAIIASHSTIADNIASDVGGGIMAASGGEVSLNHTIVADNDASGAPDISSAESVVFDHGWVKVGAGFTPTGGLQFIGVDPQLAPLAEFGGATLTHALNSGSPAIDAGNLFFTPPPGNDQRGAPFVRVVDGNGDATPRIDIGAYERQTLPELNLVVDVTTDEVNGDFSAGDLSLREAVSLANGSVGADSITFASELSGATVTLFQGQLSVLEDLTIDARPLADNVIVDASGNDPTPSLDNGDGSRLFNIDDNGPANVIAVALRGLELTGGDVAGNGGAIRSTESLQIDEATIRGNNATIFRVGQGFSGGVGGAVAVFDQDLTINGSTISGNHAAGGGGVLATSANFELGNSTISGNTAAIRGGGILTSGNSTIILEHSTIADNVAAEAFTGGGIYAFENVTVLATHTIVANNQAGAAMDISAAETVVLQYSLVEDASGFTSVGSPNITGQDPLLGPLADNGGPTQTHALLAGSAAIDAGEFGIAAPPSFDQRGTPFNRIVASIGAFDVIDIGAFEVQGASADFDANGAIAGRDFLLWQIGFGTAAPNAEKSDGDADNDGDVDADDLAVWELQFGQATSPMVAAVASSLASSANSMDERTTQPTRADLIDTVMALEWLNRETDERDSEVVSREISLPLLVNDENIRTDQVPAKRTFEWHPPKTKAAVDIVDEPTWLADELLEFVFR